MKEWKIEYSKRTAFFNMKDWHYDIIMAEDQASAIMLFQSKHGRDVTIEKCVPREHR